MSERVVYFNGVFLPESQARVSVYDSALTAGDMAYEVTRTIGGVPYRLRDHLERLARTLRVLEIEPLLTEAELYDVTLETLRHNLPTEPADMDWNIIHNISRGPAGGFLEAFPADDRRPTVIVSAFPLARKMAELAPAYDRGLDLVVPRQRSLPGYVLDPAIKTRSRVHFQLANAQAARIQPAATALLTDSQGFLTETTSGNVFIAIQNRLVTPQTHHLLPGITRGVVLRLAKRLGVAAAEEDVAPGSAALASEMFVTSTSIGILHARSLNGRPIGDGSLGPLTSRLRSALFEELGLDLAQQSRAWRESLGS